MEVQPCVHFSSSLIGAPGRTHGRLSFHFCRILAAVKNISNDNCFTFDPVYDLIIAFNDSPMGLPYMFR